MYRHIGTFIYKYARIPTILSSYFRNYQIINVNQNLYLKYTLTIGGMKNNNISTYLTYHRYVDSKHFENNSHKDDKKSIFLSFLEIENKKYGVTCPNVDLHLNFFDAFTSNLSNSSTIEEVFEKLEKYSDPLSLDQACQAVFTLSELKNIETQNFMDSVDEAVLEKKVCSNIVSHSQFLRVLETLKEHIINLDEQFMSSLMMCLNNLQVELQHELMVLFHSHILESLPKLTTSSLVQLSFVFCNKGFQSIFTQEKMLSQFKCQNIDCVSLKELKFLSIFYLNMEKVISKPTADKYLSIVVRFLEQKQLDNASEDIFLILKTLLGIYQKNAPVDVCRSLMKLLYNSVHILTPFQLAYLYSTIFVYFEEPKTLLCKIQEHASRMISDNKDISINLKSSLLLCLSLNCNFKTRHYNSLLAEQIVAESYNYKDTYTLYRVLRNLNILNRKVFSDFWLQVLSNIRINISKNKGHIEPNDPYLYSMVENYIYFSDNFSGVFRSNEFEKEVTSILEKRLDTFQPFPSKIVAAVGFLIAYSQKSPPPEYLYEYLKKNQFQFVDENWVFVTKCLQTYYIFQKNYRKDFLAKSAKLFSECLESLLMEARSLRSVIDLMTSHVNLLQCTSMPVADTKMLVKAHLEYIDELNSKKIIHIVKNLSSSISSPEIFEAVVAYVIKNEEDVMSNVIYRILRCFFIHGYHPAESTEFFRVCQEILEMDCEKMPTYHLLVSCLVLSFYQALSSELIHYIFNLPFLDQIDEEIDHCNTERYPYIVRSTLMNLNRAVCLDYPEENIPWFHAKYCRSQIKLDLISPFHENVYNALGAVLGNTNHISLNKNIPYGYNVDLEFALDYEGKPIPIYERQDSKTGRKSNLHQREIYKKVALMLRERKCYSPNTSVLKGEYQMQRRHLEILGYVVIDVPRQSWYSSSSEAAKNEDKITLLRSLIYKELTNVS